MNFNFDLVKSEHLNDISSDAFVYNHSSGAKLIFIKNDDNNKVFSASFKTLPENNKGIAHIMEHSVLCGSRKYPVKDPFNELEKGSLNTYLNAMTFEDKTVYPVASTNEKDFINLMNVYLDAVFFPLIYQRKGIFLQEGHHKERDKINGVVYNEMKGVFSSPDRIIDFKVNEKLFENTNYRFYSGGVPEFIPELSYEEFIDFHKRYYHPANCILYLYGNLDINKYLEIIDKEYLSAFDFKEVNIEYSIQKDFDDIKCFEFTYPVSEKDDNKNYFQCGAIIGDGRDYKLSFAFDILTDILLETEASPLKRAFIQNGIGDNIYGGFDSGMFQSAFSVSVEKTSFSNLDKFKDVYFDTLNQIVQKGLDKRLIESCINRCRFYFKEEDYGRSPKGLFYNILLIKSFIYNDDSFDALKFDELFDYVENIDFNELIKKYLIQNKNYVFAIMKPESKEDVINCYDENDSEFEKYSKIKDLEEDIKKIPVLNIGDIDKKVSVIKTFDETVSGRRLISSRIDKNDIVYVSLLFDTRILELEDLKYISILRYIFGKVDTKNFDYTKLTNEVNFYFGNFSASFEIYGDGTDFLPFFSINMKFLSKYTEKVFYLADEIIFNSLFNKKRIKELLSEYLLLMEKSFVKNGHLYASLRCLSYLSYRDKYSQIVKGIDFYENLKNIMSDFENNSDMIIEKIKKIIKKIFNKNGLTVGLVCGNDNYKNIYSYIESFCGKLNSFDFINKNIILEKDSLNEAFLIESEVQYNAAAFDYTKFGGNFNGRMLVLEKIIGSDYLWTRIRLEGGAYGGGCSFSRRGLFYLYSYRDPNAEKTFKAYQEIPLYLKNMEFSERELRKYIIGTINILDRPLKLSQIMDKILKRKLSLISDEKRQAERDAVLNVNKNDISEFSEMFEEGFKNSVVCSFGSESVLKEENRRFGIIKNI